MVVGRGLAKSIRFYFDMCSLLRGEEGKGDSRTMCGGMNTERLELLISMEYILLSV